MNRNKRKPFNIYYVEDTRDDYDRFYGVLELLDKVTVYPYPEHWETDKDAIVNFIQDPGKNKKHIIDLLTKNEIDLFILDEKIGIETSAGTMIFDEILKDHKKFPNLKVVIFSKCDPPPKIPEADKATVRVCYKYDNDHKKSSAELLYQIKSLTGKRKRLSAQIDDLLTELKKFLDNK